MLIASSVLRLYADEYYDGSFDGRSVNGMYCRRYGLQKLPSDIGKRLGITLREVETTVNYIHWHRKTPTICHFSH